MKERKYEIIIAVCGALVLALTLFFLNGIYKAESASELMGGLSDVFLLPGTVLTGVGLISWAAKQGLFDMLSYGTGLFASHFSKVISENMPATFYDYKVKKDEKGRSWLKGLTLVGVCCLVISFILLAFYFIL